MAKTNHPAIYHASWFICKCIVHGVWSSTILLGDIAQWFQFTWLWNNLGQCYVPYICIWIIKQLKWPDDLSFHWGSSTTPCLCMSYMLVLQIQSTPSFGTWPSHLFVIIYLLTNAIYKNLTTLYPNSSTYIHFI